MRFVKQHHILPIKNIDFTPTTQTKKHGELLPNTIRCIICGPSNCGKTNLLITLLEHPNGLKFENIYVYSKSLHQPKYEYLKKILESINGLGYYTFSNNSDVISPEEAKKNSIMIFDDVICDKQNNIRSYFCMGRHNCVDSFYLCQSYTKIPKHLIRDNCNLLVLFKQDNLNLKHIFSNHVAPDLSFEIFKDMCAECWKEKYGFVVIDKDSDINMGRYRKGFDNFMII